MLRSTFGPRGNEVNIIAVGVVLRGAHIKAWISKHIHSFMYGVITHPCLNVNSGLVVRALINSIVYMDVITDPCPNPNAG